MRDSEQNANNRIRELQREARYIDLISERAREKQRDIGQKIREVEREVGELKREIAWAAIKKQKETHRQARERRQQAVSALTEQELQEANWQARERLLQSIPTTLYPCCPDCGEASTSASRPPTTYPGTPRLPSRPLFANIQQQRRPHPYTPSDITPLSFCRCPACLPRIQEMITRPSRTQKSQGYPRHEPTLSQSEEEEVEVETPTCCGAVNKEEYVWEKYVRDDPKAKKAASKKESHAKRDRYPKRVHIVSQDEEEGESEKETSIVVEDEEKGALEDGEELAEELGEKVVAEWKEGEESTEEKKSDLEEETEDQDQVGDDKLSICSSKEEFIALVSGEDAN
jgi:hypothetical protein